MGAPKERVPSEGPVAVQTGQVDIVSGVTAGPGSGSTLSLVLFYAPWCGHSKNMLGDFDSVISSHHGTSLNGVEIEVLKVDMESDPEGAKEYDVEVKGFPTLYTFTSVGGKRIPQLFNFRKQDEIIRELENRTTQMSPGKSL
jgi:thioredoxin-like negative regulator of GroEL